MSRSLKKILVLNRGSATLKMALFEEGKQTPLWIHEIEEGEGIDWRELFSFPEEIHAIAHRVVHGGGRYTKATRIDREVKETIAAFQPFAPVHNERALEAIEAGESYRPHLPQYAVFDTAFHHTLPPEAFTYPVPYAWGEEGYRRYGFHGISFCYAAKRGAELLGRPLEELKVVICHLGGGGSLCAVKEGKSVDTTMGCTPLEGLMMERRSGTIDPGMLLLLAEQRGVAKLTHELYHESGLWGVSGISGDFRKVFEAAEKGEGRSELALAIYLHRLVGGIGAMVASLGGLDLLVFTGGIGEHSRWLQERVCERLSFLGIEVGEGREGELSKRGSKVAVWSLHAEEEWQIAQECFFLNA